MNTNEQFFKETYIPLLKKLSGHEKGQWGRLSPQGMIEHMTDSIGEAWGRIPRTILTPADKLQAFREFALSDRGFKPGTKNSLMGEEPAPLRHATIGEAISELESEIGRMMSYHQAHPSAVFTNAFFGDFNYSEWLHLLHKHAVHHLKQFDLA